MVIGCKIQQIGIKYLYVGFGNWPCAFSAIVLLQIPLCICFNTLLLKVQKLALSNKNNCMNV